MEPASVTKALSIAAKVFAHLENKNTANFEQNRDETFRLWVAQLHVAFRHVLGKGVELENRVDMLANRVDMLVNDTEFLRVQTNVGYEAAREAIDERRRMLAYAAAGFVVASLSTAQKSRVERTLRELDPVDVELLAELEALNALGEVSEPCGVSEQGRRAWTRARAVQPSGDILIAAGCIRNRMPEIMDTQPEAHVTILGRWILEVLSTYVVVRRAEQNPGAQ